MTAHVTNPDQRAKFKQAAEFRMGFGKFRGKTLDEIGSTDRGLLYIQWLRGSIGQTVRLGDKGSVTYEMMGRYLDDPAIASELAKLNAT